MPAFAGAGWAAAGASGDELGAGELDEPTAGLALGVGIAVAGGAGDEDGVATAEPELTFVTD